MKLETLIVVTKGLVITLTAASSAFVGSLAQWSNDNSVPTKLQWAIIIATTAGAGGTALGGFLSSSFGRYVEKRNGGEPPKTP
jgi:hypothetical protein